MTQRNPALILVDDDMMAERLPWSALADAIECAVSKGITSPARQNYPMTGPEGTEGRLLLMPAWQQDEMIGLKLVTYWPDNIERNLATHGASYMIFDARSGHLIGAMAGEALTHRRTAALSLIAARRLLPSVAKRLLVVGAGPVAEHLIRAHAASDRFAEITLFGRSRERSEKLIHRLAEAGITCERTLDLEAGVRSADMVACATSATSPYLCGHWLQSSAHVQLFGSFTPAMREADDTVFARATEVWLDSSAGLFEAGDLVAPLRDGIVERTLIRGDLCALLERGSPDPQGISIFKSVGTAIADFAAAKLALGAR